MKKNLFIENSTIKDIFNLSLKKFKNKVFLESPRSKFNDSFNEYSFHDVHNYIKLFSSYFRKVCIQTGDRVAIITGNIPEFFILKIALNYNGVSCVPLNYELTNPELNYIIKHSKSSHIICRNFFLKKVINFIDTYEISISIFNENNLSIFKSIKKKRKIISSKIKPSNEASLIYTSGTTGKPKGCILSHFYEINAGYSYVLKKGLISIRTSKERIYNCLPVHHVNAGILSFYAALLTGNCQIQSSRFSVTSFWKEIKYSNATIFHYLGVMVPLLLKQKKSSEEKNNNLRLGIGAGIEPSFHSIFEKRFNIPMIELWGMTEMVRCIFDFRKKYRKVGKRCFGKSDNTLETIVINNLGKSVTNEEGELLIRHNKENPKKGFFDGYYKNSIATKKVWNNNWFHTGDIVIKDKSGYLYFIDRKKNIIRRSGENIAAIEVEASLLSLTGIRNAAVCAYPHKIYEEEVLAFIILKDNKNKCIKYAKNIINNLKKKLAYYKLPAYISFTDSLPITSSQKIMKKDLIKQIKNRNTDNFYDLSEFKRSLNN
tara:strand:- start:2082 stop:3710 length:1629 start_codon:yes stop_codon:yes gene_type:complete